MSSPALPTPLPAPQSRRWPGILLTAIPVAFLTMDGVMKFLQPEPVVKGTLELGYAQSSLVPIGAALLASTLLYALPRTAPLGAVLLTGYLGGAVATHVRVGHPLFSHTLFPVYVALSVWGGLWCRDARVRALLPLRK